LLFTTFGTSKYDYRPCLAQLEQGILPSLQNMIILPEISGLYPAQITSAFFFTFQDLLEIGSRQKIDWRVLENTLSDTDILNLQFTSGSTGAPKAAALTHHGMLNCARYIGMKMDIQTTDKVAIPVPLFHAFGLIIGIHPVLSIAGLNSAEYVDAGLCANLVQGATTVLPSEYFDAASTLNAVQKYKCTGLYGVTTMFIDQLSHEDFCRTERSSLRFVQLDLVCRE
jgi:acyl-CoA synthetase (AMP-forming)/AMP-acid ligase II